MKPIKPKSSKNLRRTVAGLIAVAAGTTIAFGWLAYKNATQKTSSVIETQVSSTPVAESKPMVYLLTENYPPFNYSPRGKGFRSYAPEQAIRGLGTETVQQMFKRAEIDYTMTLRFPWEKIYNQTLETPGYGLFSTTRTAAREDLFKWVGPIGNTRIVLAVKGDSPIQSFTSMEEAKQYTIGTYRGDVVDQQLREKGFTTDDKPLADTENVKRLMNGDIQVWGASFPVGQFIAKQMGVTNLRVVYDFGGQELHLAFNKQTPDHIIQKLQASLDEMKADGTYDNIVSKY